MLDYIKKEPIISLAYFCLGIGLIVLAVFIYNICGTYVISRDLTPEDMAQTGQIGDFMGGVIGSIWALAGVLLYFSALRLQQQEMKSQREEMASNQKLLDQQLFETTFFNLLKAQENIKNGIHAFFYWIVIDNRSNIKEIKQEKYGVNFFANAALQLKWLHNFILNYNLLKCTSLESLQEELDCFVQTLNFNEVSYFEDEQKLDDYKYWIRQQYLGLNYSIDVYDFLKIREIDDNSKKSAYAYWLLYSKYEFCLSHYCRHFYNLIKFLDDYGNKLLSEIDKSNVEDRLKVEHRIGSYLSFIQSSISSPELVILYYNMLLFPKASTLYAKYNIFENLNIENLLDKSHATFYPDIKLKSEDDLKSKFFTEDEMEYE